MKLIFLILFVWIVFWEFIIFGFLGVLCLLKYFFNVVIFELIYNNVLLLIGINGVEGLIICFFLIKKFRYFCLILFVFNFFIFYIFYLLFLNYYFIKIDDIDSWFEKLV